MEIALLVITGVLSFADLTVNIFGLFQSGACELKICGCNFSHASDEVVESHERTRRASLPSTVVPPIPNLII
jgi:hypothetical protein